MGLGIKDSHVPRNVIDRGNWSESSGCGGTQMPLGLLLPLNMAKIGQWVKQWKIWGLAFLG